MEQAARRLQHASALGSSASKTSGSIHLALPLPLEYFWLWSQRADYPWPTAQAGSSGAPPLLAEGDWVRQVSSWCPFLFRIVRHEQVQCLCQYLARFRHLIA